MEKSTPNFKAIAFDVDGTLVSGGKKPEEMVQLLAELSCLFPIAFISGSSYQALETKIIRELADTGRKFDVYASGGSVRLSYDQGKPIYDTIHGHDVQVPAQDVEQIRKLVQAAARNQYNWGENTEEAFDFMNNFRYWAQDNNEGYVWSHAQKWNIKITSPGEKDPNSAIRVEARKDPNGTRVVGLSIKSIPRQIHGKTTRFVSRLTDMLRANFYKNYQILPAGFASIDVNLGNGTKTRAVEHLTQNLNIKPDEILYFGDEFGEHGNDRAVVKAGVSNIIDVSAGGPDLTVALLRELWKSLKV